jgi:hypothetical protein
MGAVDRRVWSVAGPQFGTIASRQLATINVSRPTVHRRVSSGEFTRVLPRTFAVGPAAVQLSEDGWRMASVLEAGDPAALCRASAAERLGVWNRPVDEIHVVSLAHHRRDPGGRVVFHRTDDLPASDIADQGGIPTTTFLRTCRDFAIDHTAHQVAFVLGEGAFRQLFTIEEIDRMLVVHVGEPGVAVARDALALHRAGCAGTRTRSEDRFLELVTAAKVATPIVNTPGAFDVLPEELDFAWPDHGLVVELDGHTVHGRPGNRRRDAGRDAILTDDGILVVRIDPRDVWTAPGRIVRDLRRWLL